MLRGFRMKSTDVAGTSERGPLTITIVWPFLPSPATIDCAFLVTSKP
jgi:hypothetical protein